MNELIIAAVLVGFTAVLSYTAGKNKVKKDMSEDLLNDIEKVRKARADLDDPDYLDRLLRKYG